MIIYNKLIRDRILEIMDQEGKKYETRVLKDKEYLIELNRKLQEELKEYYESGEVEELADIAKILYAIVKYKGVSQEEFERIRMNKAEKRGAFDKKLFLVKTW